jgi:hypothetical protein
VHFLALCSQIIRRILVDHARSRGYAKRGGHGVQVDPAGLRQSATPWICLEYEAVPRWLPMFKFLRFSLSIVATLLIFGLASAQTAMVRRNVNLRGDPSTSVKPITLLIPPAQLTLVEPNQRNAFYHVRTSDGKEGWV